jgi:hypothetical protein
MKPTNIPESWEQDISPLGARAALAMANILDIASQGAGRPWRDLAESIAREYGANVDVDMPVSVLLSCDAGLSEHFEKGRALQRDLRDWYESDTNDPEHGGDWRCSQ